ncbi:hypothetical protein HMPREF1551_00138 [Capnocytophaga sp. oral taxon 863 str. F0517]|nr:hypothetical protein HMPREF1551_00138 [Capnocytophaga sp. oral taxon 863 str. F0517]
MEELCAPVGKEGNSIKLTRGCPKRTASVFLEKGYPKNFSDSL